MRTNAAVSSRSASTRERAPGRSVSTGDRLRYKSDEVLSRGTLGIILWLAAVTMLVILVTAIVIAILDGGFNDSTDAGFVEGAWQSLLRVIDPGAMAGDSGWWVRLTALGVTIAGIFLASALIGIIATGLDAKIADLRKGRSFVVENGHTVILGWSPRLFTIVSELTVANENHPGLAIVVLADLDKTEMEDDIRDRVPDLRGSKLVCRSGEPSTPADLGMVNIEAARSVVVLGESTPAGDADVVKTLLAVKAREGVLGSMPAVVEISEDRTARALEHAFGADVLCVRSADVVARVTAQSCRQSGLSVVVQELLDFDGDEIYFEEAPALVGHTFAEALLAYPTSTIIGRSAADGTIEVNPPSTTRFGEGDRVIAISEDDDTVAFGGIAPVEPLEGVAHGHAVVREERMLVVGWNHLGARVLHELDQFVAPGSRVDLVVDARLVDPADVLVDRLDNLVLTTHQTVDESAEVPALAQSNGYTSVIILGYRNRLTSAEADARSLLSMLLFQRGHSLATHGAEPRVIVELLDAKDAELARVTGADDFVVSDALASLMMAQLSEHPALAEAYRQIYSAEGSALHMESAAPYGECGEITFAQVVATASAQQRVAIGWRRMVDGAAEVVVNPPKSSRVTFGPDDHVIVIG
jgi:voltage-gated potassium channel Kch